MKPPNTRGNARKVQTPGRTPSRHALKGDNSDSGSTDLDPVEVYCRIRPLDVAEKCVKMLDDQTVQFSPCDTKTQVEVHYKFTRVFGETTSQKHLFDCVGAPLIDDLVRGKNGLLFTYGITSSGKTFTMTGSGEDQGILPRCLDMVFNSIKGVQAMKYVFMPDKQNGFNIQSEADAMLWRQQQEVLPGKGKLRDRQLADYADRERDPSIVLDIDKDGQYAVFVSFIEIYNNYIYDLLEELPYDPITGSKPPQSKILREDLSRVMFVHNVSEVEVKSTEEAFDILVRGQKRRKVAHTVLNAESSRSHSVFNIRLVQAPLDPSGNNLIMDKSKVVVSQLSLVDLAGSERTNRTKSSGERLKEAGQINQSLMVLRQCIDILRENQKSSNNKMVPYRDSKITHLFKNYFDGEGKVRMIVCVNPKAAEYDETVHVMRFSEATQEVQVHRAQDKPKFAEQQLAHRSRRRPAAVSTHESQPPSKKMNSLGRMPSAPVPLSEIYSLPPFPELPMDPMDESDADLVALSNYLDNIHEIKRKELEVVQRKQASFRELLVNVEEELQALREENSRLCGAVSERDTVIADRETVIAERDRESDKLKKELRTLRQKLSHLEQDNRHLGDKLHNKNMELHKTDYEREKLRAQYEKQAEQAEVEYEHQLEQEKQRIQQEAQENLTVKDRKLRLLKNIVNQSDIESLAGELARSTPSLPSRGGVRSTTATPSYATPTASSRSKGAPERASRPTTRSAVKNMLPQRQRARSPSAGAHRPTPVRNHRRSKSAGEKWLDHRPEAIAPLETVLQPKMKHKKSVGKLEVKDTNKASRYILTTQDSDTQGNLQTKLVKGDVKPTATGGSAVVFTGVETLKQTSPGDRRRQYVAEGREDYDGEWTDTEERCNVAVEGHGIYRRIRHFDQNAGQ